MRQGQKLTAYMLNKHTDVPKTEQSTSTDDCLRVELRLLGAFALPNIELTGVIDPYAILRVAGQQQRTLAIPNTTNPEWNVAMIFPVVTQSGDALLRVSVEIWDENYTGNKQICSTTFELPGMGQDGSSTVQHSFMTAALKTPSNGDGGVLRYGVRITSFNRLECELHSLDTLAQIPFLPSMTKCALLLHGKALGLKDELAEHLSARSLVHSAISLPLLPYKLALRATRSVTTEAISLTRSVARKVLSFVI